MKRTSLRSQLLKSYATWMVGVFMMLGLVLHTGLTGFLTHQLATIQRQRAESIVGLIQNWRQTSAGRSLSEEIDLRFSPLEGGWLIRAVDSNSRLLYPLAANADPFSGMPVANRDGTRQLELREGGRVVMGVAHTTDGGWVEVAESLEPIHDKVSEVMTVYVAIASLLAVAALTGAWSLIGQTLKPVGEIAAAADRITSQNLSERLPVPPRRDEIAHLTESLNGMIHRLEEALRVNERFVADASHELRTPLTILRGELEQAALDPELRRPLVRLLEEVDSLAQLVDNLLLLSRLDAHQTRREWTQIDLAQLTVQTVEQMALLAEDKHIRIHCDCILPAMVNGDGARLKQVIVNLLDNAIKYTPDQGLITLSVRHKKTEVTLEVMDTGPGIPAKAVPHLFERFFRVDPARSRELGGSGIGLSIVEAICHVHGGRVEVESVLGRGSVFRVLLPGTARPLPF